MVGIDISGVQATTVLGTWEFVVVKLTEGLRVVNPLAGEQWVFAHTAPRRGFYHYARPGISNGTTQARLFAVQCLARGFRPGVDMWQLDAEGMLNETVDAASWRAFIDSFMLTAVALLGPAGFLYIGWPFYRQQYGADLAALTRWPWWDPDYGQHNDGNVHPISPGAPASLVVIHQYTSAGGLDRNVIAAPARFASLFHTPKPPTPAPPAPNSKVVHPMHNPPYQATWVADCNALEGGALMLTTTGGVITLGGAGYHRSPADDHIPLEAGVTWANIRLPQNVGKPGGDARVPGGNHYTCVKSNGATFAY